MTPDMEDRIRRWHEISERESLRTSRERQRRDDQSIGLQMGNPIMLQIPLDPDLSELYGIVAGARYQLTPTDILLVQVIRLYRPSELSVKPTNPSQPS